MRKPAWVLLFVGFCAVATAQQTSDAAGQPQSPANSTGAAPTPDADGVYRAAPGIDAPYLTSPAMAAYPSDAAATDRPRVVRMTVVVAADGLVGKVAVLGPWGDAYEPAATAAVQQSKFAAGALDGKPVPVMVCVRVPFIHLRPAVPVVASCANGPGFGGGGGLMSHIPPGVTPPHATYLPVPEYSNEARKKKIQGIVLLSTLVNEQGEPTDIRVVKSLGYGLDEQAESAVSRYRFEPARDRDGKAVAARVTIEVSFQLY